MNPLLPHSEFPPSHAQSVSLGMPQNHLGSLNRKISRPKTKVSVSESRAMGPLHLYVKVDPRMILLQDPARLCDPSLEGVPRNPSCLPLPRSYGKTKQKSSQPLLCLVSIVNEDNF